MKNLSNKKYIKSIEIKTDGIYIVFINLSKERIEILANLYIENSLSDILTIQLGIAHGIDILNVKKSIIKIRSTVEYSKKVISELEKYLLHFNV